MKEKSRTRPCDSANHSCGLLAINRAVCSSTTCERRLSEAYREQLPVTINSVSRSLQAVYAENRRRPDAVTSTFNDLTSWRLFEPRLSPEDFFRQSWIIDVHEATETAQRFIVFLILDSLYAFSKSLPDSAIDKRGNRESSPDSRDR